jgi:acetyl esterase
MNAEVAQTESKGRGRVRHGLTLVALVACPALARGTAGLQGVDPAARVETYKRVGAVELAIHVYVPPGHRPDERRPALVLFFGGGWRAGEPGQLAAHCRYLAQRGLVAFTAEYRVLLRHRTRARESVQDAKSALRWVRANAQRLGVDPARIAAGGASSGGHLAACCAVIEGFEEPGEDTTVSSVPAALVLFNPPLGLAPFDGIVPAAEPGGEALAARLGTEPIELSPAHHVRAGAPPTILFYGTEDFLLPGARYFERRMLAAGNRCELLLYEGEDHGFFHFGRADNVPFARTLEAADRFLVSLGYLSGEPNVTEWLRAAAEPVHEPR